MKSRPLALLVLLIASGAAGETGEARTGPAPAGMVRIREHGVLELRAPLAGHPPQARAREATEALARVLEQPGPDTVHLEPGERGIALVVGTTPVLELGPDDAAAAGTSDLTRHALGEAQRLETALRAERRRMEIQNGVFSVSFAVFITLLAFLALRVVGRLGGQLRAALRLDHERIPAFKVGTVEIASRRVVGRALRLGVRIGARVLQVIILYVWILSVLSLFAATREYGARLTTSVLRPAGEILGRTGAALPMLAVAALLVLLLALVLRTLRLFFESVVRGETHLRWMSPQLARPLGPLVQGGLLVVAVLFAAPLITGGESGALSWVAMAVLLALALGAAPVLASVAAGLPIVFGRSNRPGEIIEVGGHRGQVRTVTLLETHLEDPEGADLRVPHLLSLVHPTRTLGTVPRSTVQVIVGSTEDQARVESVLLEAAGSHASGARAVLLSLHARGALWTVSSIHPDLGHRVASALRDAGIALGTADEEGP